MDEIPLRSTMDVMILMHRDAHFGSQFDEMLDYYEKQGKGVCRDFEIEDIRALHEIEKASNQNLASLLLSGADAEKVARSREVYKRLRDLYESKEEQLRYPILIADLILSEEEGAEQEISAIVQEKSGIIRALLEVIRAEDFYDPLFPGYGMAPALAAKCLGRIGDKQAIASLFEMIGQGDFFFEDIALKALHEIGDPAKAFLLTVLQSQPVTADNERAAIALLKFADDPEVSTICLRLLKEPAIRENVPFATYLVLGCEGLADPVQQKELLAMAEEAKTLKQDILAIAHGWKI